MKKVLQKYSGARLWDLLVTGPICCIDFSPQDHWTGLGFEDGSVQLIDSDGNICWERNIDRPIIDIKILEQKKRLAVLDEGGRLVCYKFSGAVHFNKPFGFRYLSFAVMPDGFYLWGWNTGVTHIDSRGNEKGRVRTLRRLNSGNWSCWEFNLSRRIPFFELSLSLILKA